MSQPLAKLAGADLAAIHPHLNLPPEAAAAVTACSTAPEALDALEHAALLSEAVRLLSHALPKREAVWWACMCAQHTAPPDLPDHALAARRTTETWVRHPEDKTRREAMAHAQTGDFATAEAWAAVAAFWSGDSMAPEGQAPVPPAPHLTGTAVAGSVALAAVRGDPARQPERLKRFIESARDIAAGGPGRLGAEQG